jgi:hypothetical protein
MSDQQTGSLSVKTPSQKLQAYEALHALNRGFGEVLEGLTRIIGLGFRRQLVRHFQVMVEETRAWANFELTATLHEREERDWARYGRLRNRWVKRLRDPNDALIAAERLSQGGRKRSARKRRPARS